MEKGTLVCIIKTKELKTVDEVEIIEGEKIFYMTDLSSYHETEISDEGSLLEEGLVEKLKDKEKFDKIMTFMFRGW